ncbi:hypothetical protein [Lentzea sp. NPDC051838]|uniref:hypothetical protein n=1 Tax=Lentzea sp. NPDC051838 TaxID=3154849 RepID=UPI003438F91C
MPSRNSMAAKTNWGAIAAYRASDLSEVDCLSFYVYHSYAVFNATPGETYLIRR